MEKENYFEGELSLENYANIRKILKEEATKINSNLENLGLSNFILNEIKSCTSLVYRTFGNPEIIFSLSKKKPVMGNSKFTHIEFRNKFYSNSSEKKLYLRNLQDLFEKSNESLLERYDEYKII